MYTDYRFYDMNVLDQDCHVNFGLTSALASKIKSHVGNGVLNVKVAKFISDYFGLLENLKNRSKNQSSGRSDDVYNFNDESNDFGFNVNFDDQSEIEALAYNFSEQSLENLDAEAADLKKICEFFKQFYQDKDGKIQRIIGRDLSKEAKGLKDADKAVELLKKCEEFLKNEDLKSKETENYEYLRNVMEFLRYDLNPPKNFKELAEKLKEIMNEKDVNKRRSIVQGMNLGDAGSLLKDTWTAYKTGNIKPEQFYDLVGMILGSTTAGKTMAESAKLIGEGASQLLEKAGIGKIQQKLILLKIKASAFFILWGKEINDFKEFLGKTNKNIAAQLYDVMHPQERPDVRVVGGSQRY